MTSNGASAARGEDDDLVPLDRIKVTSYTAAEPKGSYLISRKRLAPEQVIIKLRESEVLLSKGRVAGEVCRQLDVNWNTYYRRRQEYGGLNVKQAKRLKELEKENARLKKLVADLSDVLNGKHRCLWNDEERGTITFAPTALWDTELRRRRQSHCLPWIKHSESQSWTKPGGRLIA